MLKIKLAVARGKVVVGKLFLVVLGGVIGASGVYVSLTAPDLLKPQIISFENHLVKTAEAETKVESTEDIIRRVASEKKFEDVETLLSIAKCESNMNRYAKNSISSARGLFQIMDAHGLSADERNNPETATKWTIDKIRKSGTGAWNSSKLCWSK